MKLRKLKMITAVIIALAMSITCLSAVSAQPSENPFEPVETVTWEGATFGRATLAYSGLEGIVSRGWGSGEVEAINMEGMPLFNGNEEDLDKYIDLLMSEMGPENWLKMAGASGTAQGTYEGGTYDIPGGTGIGGEALQGVPEKTELSTTIHAAQSWNKDLINRFGHLMSVENRGKQPEGGFYYVSSTGTSMTDMRINPLSGRYDEGYGEDPYMASLFADLNARGYNGYSMDDEYGLYELGQVQTKHYSVYAAQFFRQIISTKVGVRSFYEYNGYSANRGFADGSITSFMSSYGRINGIPSSGTFITSWANHISKYGAVYNGTDAGAGGGYAGSDNDGRWGNGYDTTYSPNAAYAASSMLAAGHRSTGDITEAVANGLNGISAEYAYTLAKAYLLIRVRAGLYDERDENGMSKYYPFASYGSDGENYQDQFSEASQAVALDNAHEGIVLLKNTDNVLPITNDANVGIYGVFGDSINGGYYAVVVADTDGDNRGNYEGRGQYAGMTAYEIMADRIASGTNGGSVTFDQGLNCVTIQNGKGEYLYVDAADPSIIQVKAEDTFDDTDMGFFFAILDNGQASHSIYSYGSGCWVRVIIGDATVNYDSIVGVTSPFEDNSADWVGSFVRADQDSSFKFGPTLQGPPSMTNNFPFNLTMEPAENEGEFYIRAGAKLNSISYITGVTPVLWTNYGFYLECSEDGTVGLGGATLGSNAKTGEGIRYLQEKEDKSDLTFVVKEVAPYGYTVSEEMIAEDDYAVIFVGQNYMTISGEGTDRVSIDMGESQLVTLENVAKAYKEAGKKTIAVIYAPYPVNASAIEANKNIDAIILSGYGGQFGSRALVDVLYGDYAPTGRLVSTWYADMDLFPPISKYSVPKGDNLREVLADNEGVLRLEDIDPNSVIDMTNADPIDTKLTYMYLTDENNAEHVTWPFGYGLSYTTFEYSNFTAPEQVTADGPFEVTVDVTNTGSVDTSEVVQLYISNQASGYADAVPLKKLVSFEKVFIPAGETATVTLTVDPADIALWDVNAEDYTVETGEYTLTVSDSSDLGSVNAIAAAIAIEGRELAALNAGEETNIWEHSFDSARVRYDEYSKLVTAASALAEGVGDDVYTVFSEEAGAWTAMYQVNLDGISTAALQVGAPEGASGTIELHIDSADGEVIGTVEVPETGEAVLKLIANNEEAAGEIHELGYVAQETPISAEGTHNLYLVFSAPDLYAATITLK